MKSILAVNSNSCSLSCAPTVLDNLIEELATSRQYNEINYHQNNWYSAELEQQVSDDIHQFLKTNIFLELISAKFLLIDATSCCNLLTSRHLNYLDYLVGPDAFKHLSTEIEVIIFIATKHRRFNQAKVDDLVEQLSSHLFKEVRVVDISNESYQQQSHPQLKNYILQQAA